MLISDEADVDPPSVFDVKILNGFAIVHVLSTASGSTFDDYTIYSHVFIPYVKKQLDTSTQIDVTWETYVTSSIKESTQVKESAKKLQENTKTKQLG